MTTSLSESHECPICGDLAAPSGITRQGSFPVTLKRFGYRGWFAHLECVTRILKEEHQRNYEAERARRKSFALGAAYERAKNG